MTPHKHAEVIKAWADGAKIQVRCAGSRWEDVPGEPAWAGFNEYRIKPDPSEADKLVKELRRWAGDAQNYASEMFRKAADEIDGLSAARLKRDMAIAEAVRLAYQNCERGCYPAADLDLASIVASVG